MEIRRKGSCIEICELDPFLAELLRQIPESTNTEGITGAQDRLFSAPAATSEKENTGIGLANTRARLTKLYGQDFTFSIEPFGQGTRVSLNIPFETQRALAQFR